MDKRKTENTPKQAKKSAVTEIGKDTGIELTESELKKASGGAINKIKNSLKLD